MNNEQIKLPFYVPAPDRRTSYRWLWCAKCGRITPHAASGLHSRPIYTCQAPGCDETVKFEESRE